MTLVDSTTHDLATYGMRTGTLPEDAILLRSQAVIKRSGGLTVNNVDFDILCGAIVS